MKGIRIILVILCCLFPSLIYKSSQAAYDKCNTPAFSSSGAAPLVMLNLERDHKLYGKAYTDTVDINEDGVYDKLDMSYNHSVEYYGYFDPDRCYTYTEVGTRRFRPTSKASDPSTPDVIDGFCRGSTEWSGNYLNYLSMTRMDLLRKVLYGGHRLADSASETILDTVFVPRDSHSWGKEFTGQLCMSATGTYTNMCFNNNDCLTGYTCTALASGKNLIDNELFGAGTNSNQVDVATGKRHLFCMTSKLENDDNHYIRALRNRSQRIWNWASVEAPNICGNSIDTNNDGYADTNISTVVKDRPVTVTVCDPSQASSFTDNEKQFCKDYSNETIYKPVGILQEFGEGYGSGAKFCSKSHKQCATDSGCVPFDENGLCIEESKMYFGMVSGSYSKNLKGGVLRKNLWTILDETNASAGNFQTSENVSGNIIETLDTFKINNYDYGISQYTDCYLHSEPNNIGGHALSSLPEGTCKMWGNPIGEMLYETMRYLAGKSGPTADFEYSTNPNTADAGLDLSNQVTWGFVKGSTPFKINELFPLCSQPSVVILSDISPNFDSDELPGSAFSSFTGDLTDLDVKALARTIGDNEGITGTHHFIGEMSGGSLDYLCSDKTVSDLGLARGLCPEEPTYQGSFYSAAVAYYGRTMLDRNSASGNGFSNPFTYSIALASTIPDIKISVGDRTVTLVPFGKSVSGCADVYKNCYKKCTFTTDSNGLRISNCQSSSYCPSMSLTDIYVTSMTPTSGEFRINFGDIEQGNDYDMDAVAIYKYTVSGNQVTIRVTSEYSSECIDNAMGYVISGTNEDGPYLVVRNTQADYDETNYDLNNLGYWDSPTPQIIADMAGRSTQRYHEKTFTVGSSSTATILKNPLWYAAKWGGFKDINGDGIPNGMDTGDPSQTKEWSDDGKNPRYYYFVANPLRLYTALHNAFTAIMGRSGTAGAVATVTQQVAGQDIVVRGAFTAYKDDPEVNVWQGHLEAYWPYDDCSWRSTQAICDALPACTWDASKNACEGMVYDFQVPVNKGKFCTEIASSHCWEAEPQMPLPADRKIFTMTGPGGVPTKTNFDSTTMCGGTDYLGLATDTTFSTADCSNLVSWIRGNSWVDARDRDGWVLGDIVYSTPVVVMQPTLATIPHSAANDPNFGSCDTSTICSTCPSPDPNNSDPDLLTSPSACVQQCFYCYRDNLAYRKKMIYVGANDGMLHAFVAGKWNPTGCSSNGTQQACADDGCTWDAANSACTGGKWIYDPAQDSEIGKEEWAYIPSNLLTELKDLAKPTYGTKAGCSHRTMVDLSPQVYDVYIDPTGAGTDRQWRTVLVGGERGGGDVYFAIDVTKPDDPKVLWEFPALRNLATLRSGQIAELPYASKAIYDQVKNLPLSWSVPYVGNIKIPDATSGNVQFLAADRINPWTLGSPTISPTLRGSNQWSGAVAVIGGAARIYDPANDLPTLNPDATINAQLKSSTLKPYLYMIDIEKGVNLFQYLWPLMQGYSPDPVPDLTNGTNRIPYSVSHPLVLDTWTSTGAIGSDGYLDHIYMGDLNGNFYGLKFNMDAGAGKANGVHIDGWKTKPLTDAAVISSNAFRSSQQPITVEPTAAFDPDYYLHVYFGTGKFDDVGGVSNDKTETGTMSFYSLKEDSRDRPNLGVASGLVSISGLNPVTFNPSSTPNPFTLGNFTVDVTRHCTSPSYSSAQCTWTRKELVGTDEIMVPDCCEANCTTSCWSCVQDFSLLGERVVDSALVAGGLVFFTTFVPKTDPCLSGGESYLYILDYRCEGLEEDVLQDSGFSLQGTLADVQNGAAGGYTVMKQTRTSGGQTIEVKAAIVAKLGAGMASRPVLDSSSQYVFVQTSDAQIHKIKVKMQTPPFQLKGWQEK